jgi:hypothetical protein
VALDQLWVYNFLIQMSMDCHLVINQPRCETDHTLSSSAQAQNRVHLLISNFSCVLNVVYFLLGCSLAYEV